MLNLLIKKLPRRFTSRLVRLSFRAWISLVFASTVFQLYAPRERDLEREEVEEEESPLRSTSGSSSCCEKFERFDELLRSTTTPPVAPSLMSYFHSECLPF
jgi:hypothetical protein